MMRFFRKGTLALLLLTMISVMTLSLLFDETHMPTAKDFQQVTYAAHLQDTNYLNQGERLAIFLFFVLVQ